MNTKHKINFKFLWGIIAVCLAVAFSSVLFNFNNKKSINAAMPDFNMDISQNQGFTAVGNNDGLIFSIEKVAVAWGESSTGANQTTKELTGEDVVTLAGGGKGQEIYFKTTKRDGFEQYGRYGVANNEYVMLKKESGIKGNVKNSEGEETALTETIVITFGQYLFKTTEGGGNRELDFATNGEGEDDGTGAGISNIGSIAIYYEGQPITNTEQTFGKVSIRTYDSEHVDYSYVLPQNAPEGRYTVQLTYRIGENSYDQPATFNFTLIREDAYIAEVKENNGGDTENVYTAKPTLTLGTASSSGVGGTVRTTSENNYVYTLGESENYPTLTYDYTRYKLDFTHYSFRTTTDYDVQFNFNSNNPVLTFNGSRLQQQLPVSEYSLKKYTNNSESHNHLATIVFTGLGNYTFSFKYIYRDNTSVIENLSLSGFSLTIDGVEELYARSKASVQFKYINFAANSAYVDLIVPNGYKDKSKPEADKIYYTTNENDNGTKSIRVGNTITSYDTNLGQTIKPKGIESQDNNTASDWAQLFLNYNAENGDEDKISAFIKDIDFKNLTTNLGSVKFKTNSEINFEKSFYFMADDEGFVGEIFDDEGNVRVGESGKLNYLVYNETTFLNDVGCYLLFININEQGNENGSYHIFAYKYSQHSVKANITDENGNLLRVDGYTNENVKVSWEQEGVFEKDIVVRYCTSETSALEVNGSDEYNYGEYTNLTYNKDGCELGEDVTTFRHYKVEIWCENTSSETYTFTIDRTGIEGVDLFKTEITTNQFGRQVYQYLYKDNQKVSADDNTEFAITSGMFALDWDAKASGANVSAKYVFVPIEVASNNGEITKIAQNNMDLVTNGYVANFSAGKIQELTFSNDGLRIINRQGIYLFILTDDAGNETRFMYVLDNTPAYLEVKDASADASEYLFGQMKTYSSETITFGAGTHKAIKLEGFDSLNDASEDVKALKEIISNTYTGNYYKNNANKKRATDLFTTASEQNYLIVKNNYIYAYDSNNKRDKQTSLNISSSNKTGTMSYDDSSPSTSMVRTFYIVGENNKNSLTSNSYCIIEINLDNSRGEAYFSNTKITIDNNTGETSNYFSPNMRLQTGSDNKDKNINGVLGAQSTRDNFVYFTWKNGQDSTEVEKITLKHYTLDLTKTADDEHFYYQLNGSEQTLYSKDDDSGTYAANAGAFNNNQNGYALINLVNGQTANGLYEITRTYKNGDENNKTLNYYFIVDRHNIISQDENIGQDISFGFYNNAIKYNSFGRTTVSTEKLTYTPTNQIESKTITYPVYLNQNATLKLPATINVPIHKYFKASEYSSHKANYPANQLFVSVYFVDRFLQLPANYNQSGTSYAKLLFEYNPFTTDDNFINEATGYFKIDLTQQLDSVLQSRFIRTTGQNSWLTLPGDYVVIISDSTKSSIQDANTQVIGFRIALPDQQAGKQASITTMSGEQEVTTTTNKVVNTNKTEIKIAIPKPDEHSFNAQTDDNYIEIEQRITEPGRQDIVNLYRNNYGVITNSGATFVQKTEDENNITFNLNCNSLSNAKQSVVFTIKLRWKSELSNSSPLFANSYYYYQQNQSQPINYFESVYTINVDRIAPSTNINNLLSNEEKPNYNFYNGDANNIIVEKIVNGNNVKVYDTFDGTNRDNSKIYAFRTTPNTVFKMDDIQYVYVNSINVNNINLTNLNFLDSSYVVDASRQTISRYSELVSDAGYYEIIEEDYAGNLTQYVIFYDDNDGNYITNLQLDVHSSNEQSDNFTSYTFTKENSTDLSKNTLNLYGDQPIKSPQNPFSITGGVFDRFYGFELSSLDKYGNTLTQFEAVKSNLSTQFTQADLAKQVIDLFKDNGEFVYGNYRLDIYTRVGVNTYYINLYRTNEYTIDAQSLVRNVNGNYEIDFSRAKVDEGDQFYYATEIVLMGGDNYSVRTFKVREERNYEFYEVLSTDNSGNDTFSRNPTNYISNLQGKYILIVTTLGNKKSSYPFDTSGNTEFKNIDFISNYYFDAATNTYYTMEQTTIDYNTMVYNIEISYSIADEGNAETYSYDIGTTSNLRILFGDTLIIEVNPGQSELDTTGKVTIYPYFKNLVGEQLDVSVKLKYKNSWNNNIELDEVYHIVIDNRTAQVNLSDADGINNIMSFEYNPTDIKNTKYESINVANGNLYLKYVPIVEQTVQGLSFDYQLFVEENNGELTTIGESNKIFVINPSLDNAGIYRFVISVNYIKNGQTNYLGCVVYTFCVEKNTGVYTPFVVQANAKILQPNENVTLTIDDIMHDFDINEDNIKQSLATSIVEHMREQNPELNLDVNSIKAQINLPQRIEDVYILNAEIDVWPYGNYNNFGVYTNTIDGYTFNLYRLDKDGVEYYIATLIAPNTKSFIQLNDANYKYGNTYLNESYNLTVRNTSYQSHGDKIIPKLNTVYVSVSHYNNLIYTKPIGEPNSGLDIVYASDGSGDATIKIVGSGRFSISFTDLAGNTNLFSIPEYTTDFESLVLTLLNNEVAVLVNNQAAINKAIYSDAVEISVPSRDAYVKIGANINALELRYKYNDPSMANVVVPYSALAQNGGYSYTFTNPGWYSVELVCPFIDSTRGELRTVLEFTIIEPTEAHDHFSFGKERTEQIIRVTNRDNMNSAEIEKLTSAFKDLLVKNNYNLLYTTIISPEYLEVLGIGETFGRQQFNITYRVDNGIYPAREVSFKISLNNAVPPIGCSLSAGQGSTKGFTISYNLGEIYNQVGLSGIYIYKNSINDNNSLVMQISVDEFSPNEIASSKVSRNGNASDGNYYVLLKTASGRIVNSFGVKITQPLNTWAIIVVVVVSVIIIAVIVTIVLLRTKMRIR